MGWRIEPQDQWRVRNKPVPAPAVTEVKKEVVKNEMLGATRIIHYRQVQYYRYPDPKNVAEAAVFEDHPEVNLIITGYADVQTGNPAYNLKLSQRRAEAVCNMMVKEFGVDPPHPGGLQRW